jgi:hypothetical protein
MVRVDMRVDHLRYSHVPGRGELCVRADVVCAWIDGRAHATRAAAKDVRGTSQVVVVERSKDHGVTMSFFVLATIAISSFLNRIFRVIVLSF